MNKKVFYFISSLFILTGSPAFAVKKTDTSAYNLSSPYYTIKNHLDYLKHDNYHPAIAAKSLNTKDIAPEEAELLAIKLNQIYAGRGYYIDLEEVPTNPDYYDSARHEAKYFPIPSDKDIFLRKVNGQWLYSQRTVSLIEEKHNEEFPLGTDWLVNILERHGQNKMLGLYYWQYFGILLLVLFSFIGHKIFTFLFRGLLRKLTRNKTSKEAASMTLLKPVAISSSLFFIALTVSIFIPVLQLPPIASKYVQLLFKGLVPFFAMLITYKLVDLIGLYFDRLAAESKSTLDDQLVPLIRKSLKIFIVIIGVLFILQNLEFNVTALLAGISIGGLAFALAAQDTIKNLFGSLMIFLDKPFQVGDWVTSGDIDGTVEEVGFRSTRVRTFRNSLVYVPNGKIADATIDNHGLRNYRRFYTKIGITYDTSPEMIAAFVKGLRKIVEEHPHTRKDVVHIYLNDFADSSLTIMFYIFFKAPDWKGELACRHEVMLEIIKLANYLGVRFAFPTQTLHMETFPEKISLTPASSATSNELEKQIEEFFKQQGHQTEYKLKI